MRPQQVIIGCAVLGPNIIGNPVFRRAETLSKRLSELKRT